jgi:hypothetical protein
MNDSLVWLFGLMVGLAWVAGSAESAWLRWLAGFLWLVGALAGLCLAVDAHAAESGPMLRAEDVLEVDGAHIRRVRDVKSGVVCYVLRWPAHMSPDLACVKE